MVVVVVVVDVIVIVTVNETPHHSDTTLAPTKISVNDGRDRLTDLLEHCDTSMMGLHHNACSYQRRALPSALQAYALHTVVALLMAALMLSPHLLLAQDAPSQQPPAQQNERTGSQTREKDAFFGEAHRRRIYEESKLSATRATLYNLALPGLGSVYAEQYFYGGIAFTLMVFTAVFVGYGFATDQDQFIWLGATTAGVAYIGSIGTSIQGVREYNTKLRQGLKLSDEASLGPWDIPKARVVGVSWRF